MELEKHYTNRSGWLRAAVLGANDGILSTTSLVIGVAAASDTRSPIVLAALAGLVAGALSMSAGEYVSVSSQSDIEVADLNREQIEFSLCWCSTSSNCRRRCWCYHQHLNLIL